MTSSDGTVAQMSPEDEGTAGDMPAASAVGASATVDAGTGDWAEVSALQEVAVVLSLLQPAASVSNAAVEQRVAAEHVDDDSAAVGTAGDLHCRIDGGDVVPP